MSAMMPYQVGPPSALDGKPPAPAGDRRHQIDRQLDALVDPGAGQLHGQQALLVFLFLQRDQVDFASDIVELQHHQLLGHLVGGDRPEPAQHVQQHRHLQLRQRLPHDGPARAPHAVGAGRLLDRPPQDLQHAARRLARADRAEQHAYEGVAEHEPADGRRRGVGDAHLSHTFGRVMRDFSRFFGPRPGLVAGGT